MRDVIGPPDFPWIWAIMLSMGTAIQEKREKVYLLFKWLNEDIENFQVFAKWIGPSGVLLYFLDYFWYEEDYQTSDAVLELYLDEKYAFKMPEKTLHKLYFSLCVIWLNRKVPIIGYLIYIPIGLYRFAYIKFIEIYNFIVDNIFRFF